MLVRNRRRDGRVDWSTPGGVIDPGEQPIEGLTREVWEETGLAVTRWSAPVYEVRAEAPELGWRLRAEVRVARDFEGSVTVEDPDGIVTEAAFLSLAEADARLRAGHPWVREPLLDWLRDRWAEPRSYGYLVRGARVGSLRVQRV